MKHTGLPEKFTRLGTGQDGREYIQCTRTGDVLVRTGDADWSHFADGGEWRSHTAPQLYPALVHLTRALKDVGSHEQVEHQSASLRSALDLLDELRSTIQERIGELETGDARLVAPVGG
ncbi:MAG: hypothetical protein JWM27_3481 [Gemmatimonadetes bacterium]|nr:hypothetical protein [Gemmatimonadota bacterium]